jgi:hypothetical protein
MYNANEGGRNKYQFYRSEMLIRSKEILDIGSDLLLAVEKRIHALLPGANQPAGRQCDGGGGADQMEPSKAGIAVARKFHPVGETIKPDRANWPMGIARSLPAGNMVA